MKKVNTTPNQAADGEYPDRFIALLRQSLEHIDDPAWLQRQAPLAASTVVAALPTTRTPQLALTGEKELDQRLRTIWHEWESHELSPQQRLLWSTVCALPPQKEPNYQVVLLLTYFQADKPKQRVVIRTLAISKATYYRYLEQAIEALATLLITLLRPALRAARPAPRPLIGRAALIDQGIRLLQTGAVVHLIGGSGLGKSTTGAHLAAQWGDQRTFWYTFRPTVSAHLDQLLFALADFLQQQGAPQLWLHLTTDPQRFGIEQALTILRHSLAALSAAPPLFCFDEVDLLLPDDPQAADSYAPIRSFLEALAQGPRYGAGLLWIGQKLLLEPEPEHCLVMPRLTPAESRVFLREANIALPPADMTRLLTYTRGNPLLLRLFCIWQRLADLGSDPLHQVTSSVSFDWIWQRLRPHLTARDEDLLQALAIQPGSAPRGLWPKAQKGLDRLITMNLVDRHEGELVSLHPAIGAAIDRTLTPAQRHALHLAAAVAYEEHAAFTRAAYHYCHSGRPELAIWVWYNHQTAEINQGQAGAALALLAPLADTPLPHPADQKALHLLLATLYSLAGQAQQGLQRLDEIAWPPYQPSTALAHAQRGHLLSHQGEIDGALEQYRRSLDLVNTLRADHRIDLLTTMGRHQLVYLRNVEKARQAALQAQFEVALLQGEIESSTGNYLAACHHYETALPLAERLNNPYTLAKLHEALGILHAYHEQLAVALPHLQQAGDFYQAYGNEVCAIGMTQTNTAWAYLMAQHYAAVIAPAEAALAYFTQRAEPYWLAVNQTNLAEAHCALGNLTQAESYTAAALRQEEGSVRPYCLYILGQIRRQQAQFDAAERYCRAAITAAEENSDPWALAPAWRALGETYRDWGKPDQARIAFQELLITYQRLGVAAQISRSQALLAALPTAP